MNLWKATARVLYMFRSHRAQGPYCVKHNQYAKHANALESGGMPSQEIFKNRCSEIEFGAILGSSYS